MLRTLIIGGTRNLGPDLVRALLARGDEVTVLNRGLTADDLASPVMRLHADRSNEAALRAALGSRSFDLVVDTTLYNGKDAQAVTRILAGRVQKYVFWSTGQVYLVRTGLKPPFSEQDYDGAVMDSPDANRTDDADNWRYGVDKRAAEEVFRAALQHSGFPFVSLRMPMIHSRRDHHQRLPAYVHRILDGGPILIPDDAAPLPLRHVSGGDVIAATLAASSVSLPAGACLNVSQDASLSLAAFLAIVADQLGRPAPTVALPRAALESRGLLPGCSPCSGRWMSILDNGAARRILGMRFAAPSDYLPPLIEAAVRLPASSIIGYSKRAEELRLAQTARAGG
ncbi:MAG TPA: NAD-dependent epimerase/dehydratase family protein [Gemmatimonadales bacterium]